MGIKGFLMAIIMALFFLSFLKGLSVIGKSLPDNRRAVTITTIVIKYIFFGIVLNVFLTLLGLTQFNFSDSFLCICLVIFFQTL